MNHFWQQKIFKASYVEDHPFSESLLLNCHSPHYFIFPLILKILKPKNKGEK